MTHLQVFDPPMCCSTGVCGPQVDPELPRFAAARKDGSHEVSLASDS